MRNKPLRRQGQLDLFGKVTRQIILPLENKRELIGALVELVLDYAEIQQSEMEMLNERKDND